MINMRYRLLALLLPCLVSLGCAASGGGGASWDGEVQVHGALRAMFHQGETGKKVGMDALLPNPDLYALGALVDLSGEITVIGGKAYLSYPDGDNARNEAPHAVSDEVDLGVWGEVIDRDDLGNEGAQPLTQDLQRDSRVEPYAIEAPPP